MKFIALAIAGLFISISAFAQQKSFPTDEELEAFKKKLQNQSDSMQNVINKKIQENQQKAASDNAKQGNTHTKKTETVKLPPLDSAAVGALPKKTFTIAELQRLPRRPPFATQKEASRRSGFCQYDSHTVGE